ncbi:hypothetical protein [Rhizobium leguminosarum]|uniref:hypothetical protein n=1 Tax=Rhizobium leguminosarum TaxID=384 RepID=UPI001441B32A|nr:hypothetical protein [Rhizobium leguminosarum]NKK80672.1 hypothetical protein [Rhizobium leguminosarum bv. viciae]
MLDAVRNMNLSEQSIKSLIPLALLAVLLSGCTTVLPLEGRMESEDETFTGSAMRFADGVTNFHIWSSKGIDCQGYSGRVTRRKGEGTFTCNGGQSGSFSFTRPSEREKGTGTGSIGDRRFTFTIGS